MHGLNAFQQSFCRNTAPIKTNPTDRGTLNHSHRKAILCGLYSSNITSWSRTNNNEIKLIALFHDNSCIFFRFRKGKGHYGQPSFLLVLEHYSLVANYDSINQDGQPAYGSNQFFSREPLWQLALV